MSTEFKLPNKKSVIFWPVGTGDSTTLVLKPDDIVMQIDLHHMEMSDSPDEPSWPIVDHLVRILPKRNGRPYLAAFVLTHPDKDHVQGFKELLRRVDIGELWHTPRIFRDQADEEALCEDAKAFRKEAHRRRDAILASPTSIASKNRLRVIGHEDVMLEDKYKRLPESCKSRPGHRVRLVDGIDLAGHFEAFIHAPFKDDQAKNKNNTSLALNVVIQEGQKHGQFFFFGDREYTTIKRIFDVTESTAGSDRDNRGYLYWDAMLSSHHCSKGIMYFQDEGDSDAVFKKDIMDFFEKYSRNKAGYIVASAHSDFTEAPGDNPPHKKARNHYEAIVKPGHFICTHEFPIKKSPVPLVFTIDQNGFAIDDKRTTDQGTAALAATVAAARGVAQPPSVQVGFGSDYD